MPRGPPRAVPVPPRKASGDGGAGRARAGGGGAAAAGTGHGTGTGSDPDPGSGAAPAPAQGEVGELGRGGTGAAAPQGAACAPLLSPLTLLHPTANPLRIPLFTSRRTLVLLLCAAVPTSGPQPHSAIRRILDPLNIPGWKGCIGMQFLALHRTLPTIPPCAWEHWPNAS